MPHLTQYIPMLPCYTLHNISPCYTLPILNLTHSEPYPFCTLPNYTEPYPIILNLTQLYYTLPHMLHLTPYATPYLEVFLFSVKI